MEATVGISMALFYLGLLFVAKAQALGERKASRPNCPSDIRERTFRN